MKTFYQLLLIVALLFQMSSLSAQWTTATIPVGRAYIAATSAEGKVFFAGGLGSGSNRLDIYTVASGTWNIAFVGCGNSNPSATTAGGRVFVVIGIGCGSGNVSIYDIGQDIVSSGTHFGLGVKTAATSAGGKAFIHGDNKVVIYNTNVNPITWSEVTLSARKAGVAATSSGSKVFFGGGEVLDVVGHGTPLNTVDIYDTATDTWSTATLSQARSRPAATSAGGKVFFAGGNGAGGYEVNTVDIYDTATDTWSTATLSQARYSLAATSVGSRVFFAGGRRSGGLGFSNVVDIYDTATNTWSTATLSQARGDIGATSAEGKAFFAGGTYLVGDNEAISDRIDIFTEPGPVAPTTPTQQPTPATQTVCQGGPASSTVTATGENPGGAPLSYQWYKNEPDTDEPVSGQNTATLNLSNVQPADAGLYYCRVSGDGGVVWSEAFTLTVNPTPDPPTAPANQTVCTNQGQYEFSITLAGPGSGGDVLEIADDAAFTIGVNSASGSFPILIGRVVDAGTTRTIYLRSRTSATNCVSAVVTVTLTHNASPNAPSITLPDGFNICEGATRQYIGNPGLASGRTLSSFAWSTNAPLSVSVDNTGLVTGLVAANGNGLIYYDITDNLGCTSRALEGFQLFPKPTGSLSLSTTPICEGQSATLTVTLAPLAQNYDFTYSDGTNSTTLSNQYNGGPIPVTVNPISSKTYSLTNITNLNTSCQNTSPGGSVTLTVNPLPVGSNGTAATCSGIALNVDLQALVTNPVPSSFTWTVADNPNISGETAGSGDFITQTLTSSSNTPQTVTYTVTPTSETGACVGVTFTVTVTVNPLPVGSNGTAPVCSGLALNVDLQARIGNSVASNFAWTVVDNPSVSGDVAGSGDYITQTLTNSTGTNQTVVYTITPTAEVGGCVGNPFTITVTVRPTPAGSNGTAAVCSGTALNVDLQAQITNSVASSFTWTVADNPSVSGEAAGSGDFITQTLTNSTGMNQTVVYTITPMGSASSCLGATFTVTVTVNPVPVGSNGTASVCSDAPLTVPLQARITNAVPSSFAWTVADNPNVGGESAGSGFNLTQTLNNTTATPQTVTYTVTPTSQTGACAGASFTVTVTVNPLPEDKILAFNSSGTADLSLCLGSTTKARVRATQSGISYALFLSGNPTALQTITGTGSTISFPAELTTAGTYTVVATNSTTGCVRTLSNTLTVNPVPASPSVSTPASQTVCAATAQDFSFTVSPGAGGDQVEYTIGASSTVLTGSFPQTITVSVAPGVSQTILFRSRVGSTGCTSTNSITRTRTVNPLPTAFNVTGGGGYCTGGTGVAIGLSGSQTGVEYQLKNGATNVGAALPGTGSALNFGTFTAAGTYTVVATNPTTTCTATMTGSATVTVNPLPNAPTSPVNQTSCEGQPIPALSVSVGSGETADWYSAASGGTLLQASSLSYTPTTAGTFYAQTRNTTTGCVSSTRTAVTLTVNPIVTPMITPGGPTAFCAGGSVLLTASGCTGGYLWSPGGQTTAAVTVSTSGFFSVTCTGTNCSSAPSVTTIVYPIPAAPTITAGGPTTFCAGGSVTLTASGCAGTYLWSPGGQNTTAITVSAGGSYSVTCTENACPSAASATTTVTVKPLPSLSSSPPACAPDLLTYSVSFTSNGTVTSNFGTVSGNTVSGIAAGQNIVLMATLDGCTTTLPVTAPDCNCPPIAAPTNPVNQTICQGQTIPALSVSVGSGETVDWYGTASGGTPLLSGSTSYTPTAAGSYFAQTRNSTTGCVSSTRTAVTLTINPTPAAPTVSGTLSFCTGGSTTLTASGCTGSYLWSPGGQNSAAITVTAGGSYSVTCTENGCPSPATTRTVTVNPLPTPVIQASGPLTFCAGGFVGLSTGTFSGYYWKKGNDGLSSNASVTVGESGSYTVSVVDANGCEATSAPVIVTVNPTPAPPTITAGGPTTFCAGGSVTLTASGCTGGTYTWSPNGETTAAITVSASGNYSVTCTENSCPSAASVATTVTVNPRPAPPTITAGGPTTFCAGGSVTLTASGCAGTYLWSPGGQNTTAITVSAGGSYSVTCTENACPSAASATTTVTVKPLPTLSTTGTSCAPDLLTYSVSFTSNGTVTSNFGTVSGNTVSGIAAGQNITLTANLDGCPTTLPVTAPDCNCPPIAAPTNPVNQTICQGQTIPALSVSVSSGETVDWYSAPSGGTPLFSGSTSYTPTAAGSYFAQTRNSTTGCVSSTRTAVTLTINPLPIAFTVTGGGSFCAGGTGVTIGLSGSELGVNYQLKNGAIDIGAALPGSGSALNFGLVTATGSYTVVATNPGTTCTAPMTGSATVTVNPLPDPPFDAVNQTICQGQPLPALSAVSFQDIDWYSAASGGTLLLSNSVFYPPTAAGTFYAEARNPTTGCVSATRTAVTLTVNPLPTAFSVTGGGSFCAGGTGVAIGLSGSETGVNYQLQIGGVNAGSAVAGTGSALNFGFTAAGTYTVVATNPTTTCTATMTGSATVTVNPLPNAPTIPVGATICQGQTIPVLSASVGSGETVDWYSAASGGTLLQSSSLSYTPTAAGTFYAEARNPTTGCVSATRTAVTLTVKPQPTLTATTPTCAPDLLTYSVSFTSNGTVTSNFGTVSGNTVSGIATGQNIVLMATLDGCTTTLPVTAPDCNCPPIAAPTVPVNQTICQGQPVPALSVSVGSGETVDWYSAPSGGTPLLSGSTSYTPTAAGSYFAQTRNSTTGCVSSTRTAVTLTIKPTPAAPSVSGTLSFCTGGSTTLTASGCTGSYLWSPGGQNSAAITVTAGGSYSVTCTENDCPSPAASRTVTVNPLPTVSIGGGGMICSPAALPVITFNFSGTVPYTLVYNNGADVTVSGIASTTYSITAPSPNVVYRVVSLTDANGCVGNTSGTASSGYYPRPDFNVSGGNTLCVGQTLSLTLPSPYTNPNWTSADPTIASIILSSSNAIVTGERAGTVNLTYTFTDFGTGCTFTGDPYPVTVNAIPSITLSTLPTLCAGTTGFSLPYTATSGAPDQYSVSGTGVVGVSNGSLPVSSLVISLSSGAVPPNVTLSLSVRNSMAGCASAPHTVGVPVNPTLSFSTSKTDVTCNGASTGTLTVNASGGSGNYLVFLNGSNTPQAFTTPYPFTGLAAGTYSVKVKDDLGCETETQLVTITQPAALAFGSPSVTNATCGASNGSFSLTATGGTGTLNYTLSPGGATNTTGTFTGLAAGDYTVTVATSNTCSLTSTPVTVGTVPTVTVAVLSGTASICSGQLTNLSVVITGGTGPYVVVYSNGSSTATVNPYASGSAIPVNPTTTTTYSLVSVTDASGCPGSGLSGSAVVTVTPLPTASVSGTTTLCSGSSTMISYSGTPNATVNYTANGNAQSVTLDGSGAASVSTGNLTTTTTYALVSASLNGCSQAASGSAVVTVISPPTFGFSAQGNGSAVSASSATENALLSVNLCPNGSLILSGFSSTSGIKIQEAVTASGSTVTYAGTPVGAVTRVLSPGGGQFELPQYFGNTYGPYSLASGSEGTLTQVYTPFFDLNNSNNLDAGDCVGNPITLIITVNAPAAPTITPGGPTAFCAGGSVTLTASGCTAGTYAWSPGNQTTAAITVSATGTYSVTCTKNGCVSASASQSVTVNSLPVPVIDAGGAVTFCEGGSVALSTGSFSSYVWKKDNVQVSTNPTYPASLSGNYTVTVTDGNGCVGTSLAMTVTANPLPIPTISGNGSVCVGGTLALTGTPTGGTWSSNDPGKATVSNVPTSAGQVTGVVVGSVTITYTYTDANGCTGTTTKTIGVTALPTASISGTATVCYGQSATISFSGTPNATVNYTINGNPQNVTLDGSGAASVSTGAITATTTYALVSVSLNGCSQPASGSAVVTVTASVFNGAPVLAANQVLCANQFLTFTFGVGACPFPADNVFTAELSDALGNFGPTPTSLGVVQPGSNTVRIPATTTSGSVYRIRVRSSLPTLTSPDSPVSFRVNALAFNSTPTVSQAPVCAGQPFTISFTTQGNCAFLPGNTFTAELSSEGGSFAGGTTSLGSVSPGINNSVQLPQGVAAGNYRVRVSATLPAQISAVSSLFQVRVPGFTTTPTVTGGPVCRGQSVRVSFSISCVYFGGNTFTAQLSDAAGGFGNPVNLGTVNPGATNPVTIPVGTPLGTGYKLRIVSSNPVVTSSLSSAFQVKACTNTREAAPEPTGLQVRVSPNPSPEGKLRIAISGVAGQRMGVDLYNPAGQAVRQQVIERAGEEDVLEWDIARQPGGLYLLRVNSGKESRTIKILH